MQLSLTSQCASLQYKYIKAYIEKIQQKIKTLNTGVEREKDVDKILT